MADELFNDEIFTLTDEDGNENQFELIGSREIDGNTYLALVPIEDNDDEYVILRSEVDDDGEEILVTIDDDEEFNRVADFFDDELFGEVDYDEDGEDK